MDMVSMADFELGRLIEGPRLKVCFNEGACMNHFSFKVMILLTETLYLLCLQILYFLTKKEK